MGPEPCAPEPADIVAAPTDFERSPIPGAGRTDRRTEHLARWPRLRSFNLAGILIHVVGYAALVYLDQGVAGPLGDVLFFLMAFTAITVPFHQFVVVGTAAVGAYAGVAISGPPAPPGYAGFCSLSFIAVGVLLARHARALASMGRWAAWAETNSPP